MSKLITENDLKGIFDEILPSDQVDYVVEQGTDGDWTYRKWNSGIAECWCKHEVGSVAVTTSSSTYGGYRSNDVTKSFPSGLFIATPVVNCTKASAQGAWIAHCNASSSSCAWIYSCTTSTTVAGQYVSLYAVGKWK